MAESSNNKENVDDSESIASDESEEMIEVDEDEFDSRRAICVADMKELEAQFLKLKEDLINEKQILMDQKMKEIEDESAEEYTNPSHKLKQSMELKIKLATLYRDYRLKNLEHIYQYELMSMQQSLENDKSMLYDRQVNKLEDDLKQLEEAKRQFMLEYNLFKLNQNGCIENDSDNDLEKDKAAEERISAVDDQDVGNGAATVEEKQSNQAIGPKKTSNKKSTKSSKFSNLNYSPVLMPGAPYIVYTLQDYDILEDWSIIKMHNSLKKGISS